MKAIAGVDGRLLRSLRALLLHPGSLTLAPMIAMAPVSGCEGFSRSGASTFSGAGTGESGKSNGST